MDLQTGTIPTGGKSMQFVKKIQSFFKRNSGEKATRSSPTPTCFRKWLPRYGTVSPINPGDEANNEDLYNEAYMLQVLRKTHNYTYKILEPEKNVILTNPQSLFTHVSANRLMLNWVTTGHIEWAALLAYIFIQYLKDAELQDLDEIDISPLFNIELEDNANRKLTAEEVRKFIMPSFKVVSDSQHTMYVRFIAP